MQFEVNLSIMINYLFTFDSIISFALVFYSLFDSSMLLISIIIFMSVAIPVVAVFGSFIFEGLLANDPICLFGVVCLLRQ